MLYKFYLFTFNNVKKLSKNYIISFPKGIKDNLANFKDCTANGIPTIVIHKSNALIKFAIHNSNPPKIIHNIFNKKLVVPKPFVTISFPNGAN